MTDPTSTTATSTASSISRRTPTDAVPSETRFVDAAGVRLRVVLDGVDAAGATPVIGLHGFTGSAESMACVSAPLSRERRVARLELVGHGESEAPDDVTAYSMDACADQIAATVGALGFVRPVLVGYSMGGRAALYAATRDPELFSSLILVGATAGIADPMLRRERIRADEALATRIENEGLEAFVDDWMALPIFATQSRLGEAALSIARAERLRNRPRGLAHSLRGMGAGAQAPVFDRLARFGGRVLLVVGEQDQKFRDIATILAKGLRDSRTEIIKGVGHAAHLESPADFAVVAREFLAAGDEGRTE